MHTLEYLTLAIVKDSYPITVHTTCTMNYEIHLVLVSLNYLFRPHPGWLTGRFVF